MATNKVLINKKMLNKRFYKSEYRIFTSFYKSDGLPTAKKLAKDANVSRTTLFRHHRAVYAIPSDYEESLLREYTDKIAKYCNKNYNLKNIFFRTLVFISIHGQLFKALFKSERKEVVKKMLRTIKPDIVHEWHIAGDIDKMYNVYINGVLGIIETWCKQDFSVEQIDRVLGDILYLTRISRQKLLPLQRD